MTIEAALMIVAHVSLFKAPQPVAVILQRSLNFDKARGSVTALVAGLGRE